MSAITIFERRRAALITALRSEVRRLEGAGRVNEALNVFQDAYDRAVRDGSPHLHVFQGDLDRIKQKTAGK